MIKGYQFGRYVQLIFNNVVTKNKITVGNDFDISFSYFKSFDESDSESTGTITIKGLSNQTMLALGDRFQTEVECRVGYTSDPENIQTLFYASVTGIAPRISENKVDINISANFLAYHLTKKESVSLKNTTIQEILNTLTDNFGVTYSLSLSGVPVDKQDSIVDFIQTAKIANWSFSGSLKQYLEKLKIRFGFIYTTSGSTPNKLNFTMLPNGINNLLNQNSAFSKNRQLVFTPKDTQTFPSKIEVSVKGDSLSQSKYFKDVRFADSKSKESIVLSYKTGLLETPYPETRNVQAYYDYKVSGTDEIVKKKIPQALVDKKTGLVKTDKKTGEIKYSKTPKKMTIARRFLKAKALINPSIKPHQLVTIESIDTSLNSVYRTRSVSFSGSNRDGDWSMEIELEDTTDFTKSKLQKGDRGIGEDQQPLQEVE